MNNDSKAYISATEIFSIGIGPSSSHTLGPWRAAQAFMKKIPKNLYSKITELKVDLYGSLALTGHGHGTYFAITCGLMLEEPETVDLEKVAHLSALDTISVQLKLGKHTVLFSSADHIKSHTNQALPFHSNGMFFQALDKEKNELFSEKLYSIGGGFIVSDSDTTKFQEQTQSSTEPASGIWENGASLLAYCTRNNLSIAAAARQSEMDMFTQEQLSAHLAEIFKVMKESIFRGCTQEGTLPGGLHVSRRAPGLFKNLAANSQVSTFDELIQAVTTECTHFSDILKWIGCCAIAVNEENAAYGRIVTAPTNGSAGVIPAVLVHFLCFESDQTTTNSIEDFLLVASAIGALFKKGATISAAMGGCQAEIGVSSAMAAAALTELTGGTPAQALMAAEIAMEHHLGLTCDPVGGLVQVPCIERNSMGAIKAIMASQIALASDPVRAKVSFDDIVSVMQETAENMSSKYKETSTGGLALRIPITIPEC